MSIFNWHKKKQEEQKETLLRGKQASVAAVLESAKDVPAHTSAQKKETHSGEAPVAEVVSQDRAEELPRATGNAHRVLLRPLITEKNTLHQGVNQYVFEVALRANKVEIQKAVENVFKVKVQKVRIARYRGKIKKFGRIEGARSHWKKAIVTVEKGDHITLLSSV